MTKTLLILGAGLTGLPLAQYVLKNLAEKHDLKVVLVSKSSEFYWNIAAPRAAIPGQLEDEKVLFSIPKTFEHHSTTRFEFIEGTVEQWDLDKQHVTVQVERRHRNLAYHTVVVATGSDYKDGMPWKSLGSSGQTSTALAKLRKDVEHASSIVVGGAGPTGVEFAAELGFEYGKAGHKSVALIMSDELPLAGFLARKTRAGVLSELAKLKVKTIAHSKVAKVSTSGSGKPKIDLVKSDGSSETIEADLFVPTWGVRYNTSFVPAAMLDEDGRIKVSKTLRIPGYDNAFALGDATNVDSYGAMARERQIRFIATALGQYFSSNNVVNFEPLSFVAFSVSTGRSRGVGEVYGWSMPSLLVWYAKARDCCIGLVPDYIGGRKLILGSF